MIQMPNIGIRHRRFGFIDAWVQHPGGLEAHLKKKNSSAAGMGGWYDLLVHSNWEDLPVMA